jgi:outer membrane protein assembly factor BamA
MRLAWFVKMCGAMIKTTFMKKILTLLVVALGAATVSNAQLQKGNVFVGADLASFRLGLNNNGFDVLLSPKAAWFINDNVAVGAYVNFGMNKVSDESPTTTTYGVGPLGRYYINDAKVNLLQHGRWFFEANVGIEGSNTSKGGGSTNGLGLGVGPGYAYFITPSIGLETLLKYNGIVGFGNTTTTSNLNLNLGFQIYLPGRATRDKLMNQPK